MLGSPVFWSLLYYNKTMTTNFNVGDRFVDKETFSSFQYRHDCDSDHRLFFSRNYFGVCIVCDF